MKKFILILGLLLCYATIAGTSQTEKVWVVNGKNIPLVSPAKTFIVTVSVIANSTFFIIILF